MEEDLDRLEFRLRNAEPYAAGDRLALVFHVNGKPRLAAERQVIDPVPILHERPWREVERGGVVGPGEPQRARSSMSTMVEPMPDVKYFKWIPRPLSGLYCSQMEPVRAYSSAAIPKRFLLTANASSWNP